MEFLNRFQLELYELVCGLHEGQKRKYTNLPYSTYPLEVARIINSYGADVDLHIEIALCHDLLEDTIITPFKLLDKISKIGYCHDDAFYVVESVLGLTAVFTPSNYPNLNRQIRKTMEAGRMYNVTVQAKIVKCADLIHNTSTIVKYDKGFAKTYLKEKELILTAIKNDHPIWDDANKVLNNAKEELLNTNQLETQ